MHTLLASGLDSIIQSLNGGVYTRIGCGTKKRYKARNGAKTSFLYNYALTSIESNAKVRQLVMPSFAKFLPRFVLKSPHKALSEYFREAIIPVKSYDFGAAINAGGGGERLVKPAEIKKRRREQSFISKRAQKTMNCQKLY